MNEYEGVRKEMAMIPDKIGNIGNTQGVKESSRPMPKKLVRISQKSPPSNIRSILFDSVSMERGLSKGWNNSAAGSGLVPIKAVAAVALLLTVSATTPTAAFATGSVNLIILSMGA